MKTLLPCLAVAAALAGALPAHAQEPQVSIRKTFVPYGDLTLNDEADARTLLTRISNAGTKVCRRNGEKGISRDAVLCRKAAIKQAVRDVDAPLVTAMYEGDAVATVLASR